jgi:hypothetical protein
MSILSQPQVEPYRSITMQNSTSHKLSKTHNNVASKESLSVRNFFGTKFDTFAQLCGFVSINHNLFHEFASIFSMFAAVCQGVTDWNSFSHLLKRMSFIVILSGQKARDLENTGFLDSYLSSNPEIFPLVDNDPDGNSVWHGCYSTFDPDHHSLLRSGMTSQGFEKRWKQHVRASWLNDTNKKWRNIYMYYPHPGCDKKTEFKRGTFDQLQQRIAVGFDKNQKSSVVDLFDWTPEEESHLGNLSLGQEQGGTLIDKKLKHLCYMFESFYAVALRHQDNITQNPGCEWQLGLYSKKNT